MANNNDDPPYGIANNANNDLPPGENESLLDDHLVCTMIQRMPSIEGLQTRKELRLLCMSMNAHIDSEDKRFVKMLNDSLTSLDVAKEKVNCLAPTLRETFFNTKNLFTTSTEPRLAPLLFDKAIEELETAIDFFRRRLAIYCCEINFKYEYWSPKIRCAIKELDALLDDRQIIEGDSLWRAVYDAVKNYRDATDEFKFDLVMLKNRVTEQSYILDGKITTSRKLLYAARNCVVPFNRHSAIKDNLSALTISRAFQLTHMEELMAPEILITSGVREMLKFIRAVMRLY